jgi:GDP/UDP-N,N'-diacetylbacillosamine 2-epimerase (hydrolysing)
MSHLHFSSTKQYRDRIIQLGENPDAIFNFGALGVENIRTLSLYKKGQVEKLLGVKFLKNNIIVTFHPVTLEDKTSKEQFKNILKALSRLKDTFIIFTKTNADADGYAINELIENYVKRNATISACYTSLGTSLYLSVLQFVDIVIGNSSSGIIEAPSFKIGTVNIGDRQKGRIKGISVIDCKPSVDEIYRAIQYAYSNEFYENLENTHSPYEGSNTAKRIMEKLVYQPLDDLLKKHFYDTST